ncbi:MAG: N-acetyltransferase [Actinomycetia bacterium]|nr:N-acetyltransferase [Actinomycetes bacterium]
MDDLIVRRDDAASRYEAILDGQLVGLADFTTRSAPGRPDTVVITHTESRLEGRGIASALVRAVLDDLRARNSLVVPACPFVAKYIERHPEHADLLATA